MDITFAKHISDKGLISRLHKAPLQPNNKKTNNLIKNWTKDMNRHIFQRRHTDVQKAHEKMLDLTKH